MVNVGRQAEVGVRTALVCRYNELRILNLELNERQTRSLVALRVGGTEEQDIVLGTAALGIDPGDKRRQLLKICRVTVDEDGAAIVPSVYAGLAVLLHRALAAHEELQFGAELFAGYAMPLENIEQVGRGKRELLVDEIDDIALAV